MIHAEATLYPHRSQNAGQIINQSLDSLRQEKVEYVVGPMATHMHGSEADVWHSLKKLFDEAKNSGGEVSMVVTITNSPD